MNRSLWMVTALVLAVSAQARVNPTEMVDVSRGGLAHLELRQDTAPTVAELAAQLRAEGHGPVDEAHLARSLARGESYLAPCGHGSAGCRTLAYAPPVQTKRALDPASFGRVRIQAASGGGPRFTAPRSSGGSSSGLSSFLPLLVGILQLFLGLSMGGGPGYAGNPGYPGFTPAGLGPTGSGIFSQPSSPSARTSIGRSTLFGTGGASGRGGVPGVDTSVGRSNTQASTAGGQSFFEALPLPQGSWTVGPNGHFWDCRGSGCGRPHHGNDLHAKAGTPVFSVAGGTVKRIKHDPDGYDWYIIIQHDATSSTGRRYNTLYGHIAPAQGLAEGARVQAGQQIATVNPEGVVSPHCHFEVLVDDGSWKGVPVNPDAFADFHQDGERGTNGVYASREPALGRGLV